MQTQLFVWRTRCQRVSFVQIGDENAYVTLWGELRVHFVLNELFILKTFVPELPPGRSR